VNQEIRVNRLSRLFTAVALLVIGTGLCKAHAVPRPEGLKLIGQMIARYNMVAIAKSLDDETYKGEAGILRVSPETGRALGLRVRITKDYRLAIRLLSEADEIHEQIVKELKQTKPGGLDTDKVNRLVDLCISYKSKKARAAELLAAYYQDLNGDNDERLDQDICKPVLEKELFRSLERYGFRIRDSLADFFNRTYVGESYDPPLRPENVDFVNSIFNEFVKSASREIKREYDLDSFLLEKDSVKPLVWKMIFPPRLRTYAEIVERLFFQSNNVHYKVHPVLFMALMRRESNFDPVAVSQVGAVGLTQIMPSTAKQLGMQSVYDPSYFREAGEYLRRARQWRAKALALIEEIEKDRGQEKIRRAWSYMQKSISFAKKSQALFSKYEKELLNHGADDRLDVEKAIRHGYRYFMKMLNRFGGDISLALAAYNAGPGRVKKYGGIPPFPETVSFRNAVLGYYREYLSRLSIDPLSYGN